MEIERRRTKTGNTVHRVRWRDPEGHRRTRTFETKNDAEMFAADLSAPIRCETSQLMSSRAGKPVGSLSRKRAAHRYRLAAPAR
jgi:hypothetical protein